MRNVGHITVPRGLHAGLKIIKTAKSRPRKWVMVFPQQYLDQTCIHVTSNSVFVVLRWLRSCMGNCLNALGPKSRFVFFL